MPGRINDFADKAERILSSGALDVLTEIGRHPRQNCYVTAHGAGRKRFYDQAFVEEIENSLGGIYYQGGSRFVLTGDTKKVAKRLAERRDALGPEGPRHLARRALSEN